MLTDEELAGELKLAFADATEGLAPGAGLGAAIHRRHRAARRRAVAARVAIPAAAACASGVVVANGSGTSASSGPSVRLGISSAPTTGSAHQRIATAAYRLELPAEPSTSFSCLNDSVASISRDGDTWYVGGAGNCMVMVVDTDTALPEDARPIELAGIPGLYGTSDDAAGTRTIYSRNGDGGWSALTVGADTSEQSIRGFYVPVADRWVSGTR